MEVLWDIVQNPNYVSIELICTYTYELFLYKLFKLNIEQMGQVR